MRWPALHSAHLGHGLRPLELEPVLRRRRLQRRAVRLRGLGAKGGGAPVEVAVDLHSADRVWQAQS